MNRHLYLNKKDRGFAAIIAVVLVSAALISMVLQNTNIVSSLFDEANHKQYRLSAVQSALSCLDQTFLEITHDYFFEVTAPSGVSYQSLHCSIVSVGETPGHIQGDGYETITVSGFASNVTAMIVAQVLISDQKINLLSEKTLF